MDRPPFGGTRFCASGDIQKHVPPFFNLRVERIGKAPKLHLKRPFLPRKTGILAAKNYGMRDIKLSGREAAIVRAIGFAESMLGAEILDSTRMEPEDVGDTLNGLIAAGFVETIPYAEQIDLAEMPTTAFEVNPAYVHELRVAIARR